MVKTASEIADSVLHKLALMYEDYQQQTKPFPTRDVLLGGALGGGIGHFIAPNESTRKVREVLSKLDKTKPNTHLITNLPEHLGGKMDKFLPTAEAESILKGIGYRLNAPRVFAGLGLGALGGYALHRMLSND